MSLRSPGRGKCDGRTLETNGTAWHSILQLTEPQRSQRASRGPGPQGLQVSAARLTPSLCQTWARHAASLELSFFVSHLWMRTALILDDSMRIKCYP